MENSITGDAHNHAGPVDENQVERYQRVLHPETARRFPVKQEQHARIRRQFLTKHQPLGALLRCEGKLHRKCMKLAIGGFDR